MLPGGYTVRQLKWEVVKHELLKFKLNFFSFKGLEMRAWQALNLSREIIWPLSE